MSSSYIPDNTLITLSDKPSEELIQIRSAFSPKIVVSLKCDPEKDLADQSQAADCDINRIMAQYDKTGVDRFADRLAQAQYGDATGLDYVDAMNTIANANSLFAGMPAKIRAEFDNSPQKFLTFMEDPDNTAKMVSMGLAKVSPIEKQDDTAPTPSLEPKSAPKGSKEPAPNPD